ncbi:TPA: DNA-3-methyladenine glycosylase 2 [Klebsiella pneumoniae]|nr:DNA-3-methyladenine glycosylase 2 [Klebsiella pneumoniae]
MVLLPWTPPYDWAWMVGFLQARAVAGVERFDEGGYSRSFGVEGHRGLIHLAPDEEAQGLRVTLSPGLRLPGALDAFEQAVRAVLGQLVSVAMAARLTAKVAAGWGEPLAEAPGYVLFPTPEALSRADPQALKALGMPLRRAEALIHLARAALSGELPLKAPADIDAGLRQLQSMPGIGRWTANYFALRGWQAKDIFLPDDYLIKQRFPGMTPAAIARYARRWQPMRSYALLHIWYTDDWIPAAE